MRVIKADEIAARPLFALKQHYNGKLKLSDVREKSPSKSALEPHPA